MIIVLRQLNNFSAIPWQEQVNFQWDDDDVHAWLDFYSNSSLKQQFMDRHVAPHNKTNMPREKEIFLTQAQIPWLCEIY
jgi:hypothetical protein